MWFGSGYITLSYGLGVGSSRLPIVRRRVMRRKQRRHDAAGGESTAETGSRRASSQPTYLLREHTAGGEVKSATPVDYRRAPIQAHHRIRRHPLQRLADSEERAHGARARSIARSRTVTGRKDFELYGSGPDRRRRARARSGGASRRRHRLPPETLRRRLNDELPADINILAARWCRTASMPGTTRWRAATSIRCRRAGPRSPSRTSGG